MAKVDTTIELELCKKIMLRAEDIMERRLPYGPDNYAFDGYSVEQVDYNIREMSNASMIDARIAKERFLDKVTWPVAILPKGLMFLLAAHDDSLWSDALSNMPVTGDRGQVKHFLRALRDMGVTAPLPA